MITTNVDYQFYKAGFGADNIFAVQGDYGYLQCDKACHQRLYYNENQVAAMLDKTTNCRIPSDLVPQCPVCGGIMDVNLRHNSYFVQDEAWYVAEQNCRKFMDLCRNRKTVYLEPGVGFNTPDIIRYPFEQYVYGNPRAVLIRLNRDYPEGAPENAAKTIAFAEDMDRVITDLQL